MGRIKTKYVKRVTKSLIFKYKDKFKPDFRSNKTVVSDLIETKSKKLKNVVAGYATRLVKETKE